MASFSMCTSKKLPGGYFGVLTALQEVKKTGLALSVHSIALLLLEIKAKLQTLHMYQMGIVPSRSIKALCFFPVLNIRGITKKLQYRN